MTLCWLKELVIPLKQRLAVHFDHVFEQLLVFARHLRYTKVLKLAGTRVQVTLLLLLTDIAVTFLQNPFGVWHGFRVT